MRFRITDQSHLTCYKDIYGFTIKLSYATVEGTSSYPLLKNIEDYHFRKSEFTAGLTLSSLGLGSYLGGIDKSTVK